MERSALTAAVSAAYEQGRTITGGALAAYIPELARANPDRFAVAACSHDGAIDAVGDVDDTFTIQSICKPFLYAAALEAFGGDEVQQHVDVEPTGNPFDSYIRLESEGGRPHNPMINAGAIAISAMLARQYDIDWLLAFMRRCAARPDLHIDVAVYLSERATADRNHAIAYLLQHVGRLAAPVDRALDFYIHACAVQVNTRDLAAMAATLAAGGRNPLSGETLFRSDHVRDVLTVMATCGMYDGAGTFMFDNGLPAKSGVAGGVVAVAKGQLGLAAWSPPLDGHGNSVRGVKAISTVSAQLGLHIFGDTSTQSCRVHRRLDHITAALEDAHRAIGGDEPLALAICGVDGTELHVGDATKRFPIQAASNPFTYAFALSHNGVAPVHNLVGKEPSGNRFNAVHFNVASSRPFNPLDNAGAITIASTLPGDGGADRLKQLLAWFRALSARDKLTVDASVLAAEHQHGNRNRAIAHLLRAFGVMQDIDRALDLYFQQCSILVDCRDLARMGATLAAGGRNPVSGQHILSADVARCTLSIMYMCGMHDRSGRFAFEVGMPAKSGISGCIVAAVPGRFGIAAYSPCVDGAGTSIAGVRLLRRVSAAVEAGTFAFM